MENTIKITKLQKLKENQDQGQDNPSNEDENNDKKLIKGVLRS